MKLSLGRKRMLSEEQDRANAGQVILTIHTFSARLISDCALRLLPQNSLLVLCAERKSAAHRKHMEIGSSQDCHLLLILLFHKRGQVLGTTRVAVLRCPMVNRLLGRGLTSTSPSDKASIPQTAHCRHCRDLIMSKLPEVIVGKCRVLAAFSNRRASIASDSIFSMSFRLRGSTWLNSQKQSGMEN